MQLDGVPALLTLGGIQNLVASVSKSLQGAVNFLTQLYRDYQLATYRYGLAHGPIVAHPDLGRPIYHLYSQCTYMGVGFPPDTKPAAMVRVSSPKIW